MQFALKAFISDQNAENRFGTLLEISDKLSLMFLAI